MARAAVLARDLTAILGLMTLVLFPLPSAAWQIAQAVMPGFSPSASGLSVLFEGWDCGAQQPLSRAILRALCAALLFAAWLLPGPQPSAERRWPRLGALFLGLGVLSASLAPHRYAALQEWEVWFLTGGVAYLAATRWNDRLAALCLGLVYLLTCLTSSHSLLVAIPETRERLGGLFYHPNALSTFCLMLLAVTMTRAFAGGRDSRLAQVASGLLLGLAISSGSVTGGAIMLGVAMSLAFVRAGRPVRVAAAVLGALALVCANLGGGWASVLALPIGLTLAWFGALAGRHESATLSNTWGIASVAGAVLCFYAQVAPPQSLGLGNVSRAESGLGRVEFASTALWMAATHPALGMGPAAFSRVYPSRQTTVAYFSKFPHCLPLEIASEWGIPALLILGVLVVEAFRRAARAQRGSSGRTAGWILLIFTAHASTDVQTQFPYLLLLAALALGVTFAEPKPVEGLPEEAVAASTRVLLSLACLALLVLELSRVGGAVDRTLALALARRAQTPQSQRVVESLLADSYLADPLDSESARLWALSLLSSDGPEVAGDMADMAVGLDPHRASCLLVQLTSKPPQRAKAAAAYRAAAMIDRMNYPIFYRLWAQALWEDRRAAEARQVLVGQSPCYAPSLLVALPEFRSNDLEDQLVEFHALKAVLEEEVQPGGNAAEPDLRLAVRACDGQIRRLQRLADYPDSLGRVRPGPLTTELQVLLQQIETQNAPGTAEAPLHQP